MARRTPWNPNTADWLVRQRGKRTQDAVVADMAARGVQIKRAWLSRIENGAPFSDELLTAFEDYYGSVPPPFEEPRTEPVVADYAEVVAAIDRQTKMLERVLMALVGPEPDPPIVARAEAATADAERQWLQEQARNTSPLRRPARGRRVSEAGQASREDAPA